MSKLNLIFSTFFCIYPIFFNYLLFYLQERIFWILSRDYANPGHNKIKDKIYDKNYIILEVLMNLEGDETDRIQQNEILDFCSFLNNSSPLNKIF